MQIVFNVSFLIPTKFKLVMKGTICSGDADVF